MVGIFLFLFSFVFQLVDQRIVPWRIELKIFHHHLLSADRCCTFNNNVWSWNLNIRTTATMHKLMKICINNGPKTKNSKCLYNWFHISYVCTKPSNVQLENERDNSQLTWRRKNKNHKLITNSFGCIRYLHLNSCWTHCIREVHRKHDFRSCFSAPFCRVRSDFFSLHHLHQ